MAAKFQKNWQPEAPAKPAAETPPPAQEKPAEKPAAPAPDPDDEPSLNRPITREDFKRLSQSRKEFKEQVAKLKAEHEAATAKAKTLEEELTKTKSALPPNIEDVQKALADSKRVTDENKTLIEQLETLNLERSPRFQNWWKTETAKHIKVAQSHVPLAQREELEKLLLAPSSPERDAALDEIIDPLSNTAKRLAHGAIENLESLKIQRDEALTKGSEGYKLLKARERAEAEEAEKGRTAKLQSLTDEALRRSKQFTAFQPTGDAAKDGEIAGREAFVRAVVAGKVDEDTMLNVPAAAVEYLHQRETVIPALKAEIAKQAELIKQLQGSGPSPKDGHAPGKTAPNKEGTSFEQKVKELWPNRGS